MNYIAEMRQKRVDIQSSLVDSPSEQVALEKVSRLIEELEVKVARRRKKYRKSIQKMPRWKRYRDVKITQPLASLQMLQLKNKTSRNNFVNGQTLYICVSNSTKNFEGKDQNLWLKIVPLIDVADRDLACSDAFFQN